MRICEIQAKHHIKFVLVIAIADLVVATLKYEEIEGGRVKLGARGLSNEDSLYFPSI